MKYVISGLPDDSARQDLNSLYSSAPREMYPPLGFFSRVLEPAQVFTPRSPWILGEGPPFVPFDIDFTFGDFKHVFNTELGFSQFVCTLKSDSPWNYLASAHLGLSEADSFLPYMVIMKDGMQSSKTKSFCLSVSNYLANQPVKFLIQPTSMSNVVGLFSPEVENVFQ